MEDAFGPAGCAGRVEDEEGIFGVHRLRLADWAGDGEGHLLVPPVIAAGGHLHVLHGTLEDDHRIHNRAALDGLVRDVLEVDGFAAQPGAVTGDQYPGLGVVDAAGEGLLAEPAIDDGVHGADLGDGQHRDH